MKVKKDNEESFINRLRYKKAQDDELRRQREANMMMREVSTRRKREFSEQQLSLKRQEATAKRQMTKLSD
eukprot:CAMPEP_0170510542 /NCGR_PEP_ID=MMETSP0208-20121228/65823_1 /TAXON_ID=197538 /ORGANISM="Strombidium inclinatum, Strain S3" /LENGTH=69 /DNA_ID=CAMNT_0010794013 /DNA_START=481 /DNA_END=690 /DNA_ORIENTATION=+